MAGSGFRSRLFRPNRWRLWVQAAFLGALVLIIPILLTSRSLLKEGHRVLVDHETIDLSDDSNLRVTEIQDDFTYLARDVRTIAKKHELGAPNLAVQKIDAELALRAPPFDGQPKNVREVRRRLLSGCSLGVFAFDSSDSGKITFKARLHPPEADPSREAALHSCLADLARRLKSPYDRSGLFLQPANGSTSPRCIVALGVQNLAPMANGQFTAVVIDFTQYIRNRQRTSPRHLYFVADRSGTVLIHPYGSEQTRERNVTKLLPWEYPKENWFDNNAGEDTKQLRLANAISNGGSRLKAADFPEMGYYYRKGYFGENLDLKEAFPDRSPLEVALEFNREMARELDADPLLRVGQISAGFDYVEVSHPKQTKLESVCVRIDTWCRSRGRPEPLDWSRPVHCSQLQGQLLPLRLDQNDTDDPSWLIVGASPQELAADIDYRFARIDRQWVYPTLIVSCLLGIAVVVTLTRSLRRLVAAAQRLDRDDAVEIPLDGPYEISRLAHTLAELTERVKARDRELRKLNDDLESRVKLRTTELEVANAKLDAALKQAEAAGRTKDAFVANMSHELRQPLHIIIGFTEALKEDAADLGVESILPDLEKILTAAKHLLDLINDILDLAKISSGKMELAVARFELPALLNDVRMLVAPLAEKNENAFEISLATEIGAMVADERRVKQILLNLLSNAFKFTRAGRVTLGVQTVFESGVEWIQFSVKDSGKGMTPEQVDGLFQRFYQVDSSTTREQGGTGLGLSITLNFVEMMGGPPIRVNSQPGRGSEFIVRLPRRVGEATTPNEALTPATEPATGRTVLVIDDDLMVRELMERFLAKDGFRVLQATNGEEGLKLARSERPSVVTLDVMMPGSDGWTVLAELKSDPATADIPVVMLTIVDDRRRGFALGAADYLTKPIDWQRLGGILRRYSAAGTADTVLVVEDNPESREVVRKYMEREGWTVIEAADGEQGLALFADSRPALVLLDLMMPVLDGFGFLDELAKRFPNHRVPVVVLTAKELNSGDFVRLNGRVSKILEKGDLRHLEQLVDLVREQARR